MGCLSKTHRNELPDSPAPSGLRLLESSRSGRNRICGQLSPGPQLPVAHHVRNTIRLLLKSHWKGSSHLDNQEHKQGRTVLAIDPATCLEKRRCNFHSGFAIFQAHECSTLSIQRSRSFRRAVKSARRTLFSQASCSARRSSQESETKFV